MKIVSHIVAALLGLIFVVFGLNFWLHFIPIPPAPEGTPAAAFLGAMYTSGYLGFVKAFEIIGGALLFAPRTRNWGLIIIGPIVLNIAAIHHFLFAGIKDPTVIFCILAVLFLAYVGRKGFCCLACCGSSCCGDQCCGSSEGKEGGCCSSK
jgi:hypothetical protein